VTTAYRARREDRDGVEVVCLEGPEALAEVAPGLGNNCFSFRATRPLLEPVSFDDFRRSPGSYGIPIMFPFPNRIRDGRFTFEGESFTAEPARHGFVRDKRWKVEDLGADEDCAFLRSSLRAADCGDAILGQFPFPFRIAVTYTLRGAALEMETIVANEGDRTMPWGFGIHPWLRKPERGTVQVPAAWRWELEEYLPTGRMLPAEGAYDLRGAPDLDGLSLDDVFTGLTEGRCLLNDSGAGLATEITFAAADFPQVVVYTPKPPRAAVCIEPQTCPTDAFNLDARGVAGAGVRRLAAGASSRLFVKIEERLRES
jgi:aldose 1-epimerase